jgi:hypothetical protein
VRGGAGGSSGEIQEARRVLYPAEASVPRANRSVPVLVRAVGRRVDEVLDDGRRATRVRAPRQASWEDGRRAQLSVMPGHPRRPPRPGAGPPAPPQLEHGSRPAPAPPATATTGSSPAATESSLSGAGSGPGRQAPPATANAGSRPAAARSGLVGPGSRPCWCGHRERRRGARQLLQLHCVEPRRLLEPTWRGGARRWRAVIARRRRTRAAWCGVGRASGLDASAAHRARRRGA